MRKYNIKLSAKELDIICNALAVYRVQMAEFAEKMSVKAIFAEQEVKDVVFFWSKSLRISQSMRLLRST